MNLNDKLYGNRWLNFYELNGLSKAAFGDSKRLVVSSTSLLKRALKYKDIPVYNFSNWNYSQPITAFISDNPKNEFNAKNKGEVIFLIKLKYWEIFNKKKFNEEILKLVDITI